MLNMSKEAFIKPVPDTSLEDICRAILTEMRLRITASNDWLHTPFSIHPKKPDFIVEDILIIEVQGHKHKTSNIVAKKDVKKRNTYEAMGYGVLWLWEKDLKYANQVKRGKIWRPHIKGWIRNALEQAHNLHYHWIVFQEELTKCRPKGYHPLVDKVIVLRDRE